MIFINPDLIQVPPTREAAMLELTQRLTLESPASRQGFIESARASSWRHSDVLSALRSVVGNKCWYSEVHLDGSDPDVDHFRPKGRVREVDSDLRNTQVQSDGYWWLAFEPLNFRLASVHSNQRRVDTDTAGGKSDYFPVRGPRATAPTSWGAIAEDVLAIDPCSASDVRLLWFDPDGVPSPSAWKGRSPDARDIERVRVSIWLYHLDKQEIHARRSAFVQEIRKDLRKANTDYLLWARDSMTPSQTAKLSFDQKLAEIVRKTADDAEFAGAKRCAVRAAMADYPWIEEYLGL